jgi:hypothetical protein
MIAICLALTLTTFANAENEPPGYQHIKDLDGFIGEWTARFDPPGKMPEGELTVEFRHIGNKSYIQQDVRFKPDHSPDGKQLNPEFSVIGYCNEASTTKIWSFKYENQGRASAEISAGKLIIQQQEGTPGEAGYRMQSKTVELVDDDTMRVTTIQEQIDEEPTKEEPLTLTRAK